MVHDHGSYMDARRIQAQTAYSSESICTGDFMLCDDHARSDPGTFYVDLIQQGRYKKPYFYLGCAAFGNFLICLVLHLTGTADFIETLPGAHVILAVTFFLVFLTFCLDMRKKEYRKNKLVLIGLIIAMLAIAIESISTYFVVLISGLFIGVSMLILLFINIIRTIKNVHTIEMHRQKEELLKRKRQMEKFPYR